MKETFNMYCDVPQGSVLDSRALNNQASYASVTQKNIIQANNENTLTKNKLDLLIEQMSAQTQQINEQSKTSKEVKESMEQLNSNVNEVTRNLNDLTLKFYEFKENIFSFIIEMFATLNSNTVSSEFAPELITSIINKNKLKKKKLRQIKSKK